MFCHLFFLGDTELAEEVDAVVVSETGSEGEHIDGVADLEDEHDIGSVAEALFDDSEWLVALEDLGLVGAEVMAELALDQLVESVDGLLVLVADGVSAFGFLA